ncbi:MAG: penicillin-binding protein 2 [Anaerolineae bacterium]|nr:MAG: penicillin-binding protein 2 [Anaerolineae bacterium]
MRKQFIWRSQAVAVLFTFLGFSVVAQVVRIQNSPEAAAFLRQQSDRYAGQFRTIYPTRGEIYDRNGYLLAGNQTVYEIGVDLKAMRNPHTIALALSTHLGMDYNRVYEKLINPPQGQVYLPITDFVPAQKAEVLQQLIESLSEQPTDSSAADSPSLAGLEIRSHLQRSYPEGDLAANVLGFVTREGRGYFGVEEKYNDNLAGKPVTVWVPLDPNRVEETPKIPQGATLILTLDRELQLAVEDILAQALYRTGAENGTIVVMDPRNGEILAMASTPRMDLNRFWNYDSVYQNASEFNRAVSMPYEPGSVMKVFTMAAALDTGVVSPDTPFLDTGAIQVGGVTIKNWDEQAWGPQTMLGCMQHSLNVCLAWVATQLGPQTFYDYMQRFGFGHATGIDLAGEATGRLKVPGDADWYPVDLGTNAFGQGVTVTPIQMVMAASAITNGGRMVTPHVLYAMVEEGQQYNTPIQYAGTPISAEAAHLLSEMLAVSLEGESSAALVPGYRVAGKTGTAQIPTPYGYYTSGITNASFIGWGPVDDPRFIVYVWLEKPTSSIWGSETAAPVFAEVVRKTVVLLDIPPDAVRQKTMER